MAKITHIIYRKAGAQDWCMLPAATVPLSDEFYMDVMDKARDCWPHVEFAFIREISNASILANPSADPAGDYHRSKGCCDGTDPSGCYRRQEEAAADERIRKRVEAREIDRNEYSGTEPSDGDMVFCSRAALHQSIPLGYKCNKCGFTA